MKNIVILILLFKYIIPTYCEDHIEITNSFYIVNNIKYFKLEDFCNEIKAQGNNILNVKVHNSTPISKIDSLLNSGVGDYMGFDFVTEDSSVFRMWSHVNFVNLKRAIEKEIKLPICDTIKWYDKRFLVKDHRSEAFNENLMKNALRLSINKDTILFNNLYLEGKIIKKIIRYNDTIALSLFNNNTFGDYIKLKTYLVKEYKLKDIAELRKKFVIFCIFPFDYKLWIKE